MKSFNDIAEGFANDVSGGKVPIGNWKFTYHSKGNGKWFANSVKDEPGVTIHHQSDDRAVIEAPAHVHSRLVHSARNLRKDGRVTDKNDVNEAFGDFVDRLKAMVQVPEKGAAWKDPDNTPKTQGPTPGKKTSVVKTKPYKKPNAGINPNATSMPASDTPSRNVPTSINPINIRFEEKGIDAGLQAKERRERVVRNEEDPEKITSIRNLQQQIFHKVMENAGLQGTTELADKYAEETPGQKPRSKKNK